MSFCRRAVILAPAGSRGGVRGARGRPDRPVSRSEAGVLLPAAQAGRGLPGGAPISPGKGNRHLLLFFWRCVHTAVPPLGVLERFQGQVVIFGRG